MDKLQTYESARAWSGPELAARRDWIYTLSKTQSNELVAAAESTSDQDSVSLEHDDFDLPTLEPVLKRVRTELLEGRGVTILRGLPIDDWPIARTARVYWAIASRMGVPIAQNALGNVLGHVFDVGGNADDPHQRAHQSTGALPFHTDISAEIVGLLCIRSARLGGASALASVTTLWNELVATHPNLAAELLQPFHLDRRGDEIKGQDPWFHMPILALTPTEVLVCHNPRFIRSAQRFPQVPALRPIQEEAIDLLQALADDPRFKLEIDFQPGDIQLINNMALLHSRNAYEDWPEPERRRHLLRLWLSVPDGRLLPKAFFARQGADPATGRPAGFPLPTGATYAAPLEAPHLIR